MPGDEGDGIGTIRGGDHAIAVAGEDSFGHLAERFFILDDENGLSLRSAFVGRGLLDRRGGLVGHRKHHGESGTRTRFGLDGDRGLGLADDPVDGGQAQSGPGAVALGAVEGLEGVGGHFGRHAGAGVADPKAHVPSGSRG